MPASRTSSKPPSRSYNFLSGRERDISQKKVEGVYSETCGHPRPHKREGPAGFVLTDESWLSDGNQNPVGGVAAKRRRFQNIYPLPKKWRSVAVLRGTISGRSKPEVRKYRPGRCRKYGKLGRWWPACSASISGGTRWKGSVRGRNQSLPES